jgi:flagellar hook protein FlgE
MSFQTGLSGLNAASRNLDVIGNNIANANTTGMKQSRTEFSAIVASTLGSAGNSGGGIGVGVAAVTQQFSQGNLSITGNNLDVAINGGGFFQLKQPDGTSAYTRDGSFKLDKEGFLKTNGGANVLGYSTDSLGVRASAKPDVSLRLPTGASIPAAVTKAVTAEFNLDARATPALGVAAVVGPPAVAEIPPTLRSTYATSVNIYDAQGVASPVNLYFEKAAPDPAAAPPVLPNSWRVFGGINTITPPVTFPSLGTLTFDGSGKLTIPAMTTPTDPKNVGKLGFVIPASAFPSNNRNSPPAVAGRFGTAFDLVLNGTTQFGSAFAVSNLAQDGYSSGDLVGINIEENGLIAARYSNGQTQFNGQIALANFRNVQGLSPQSGNSWAATFESGDPITGQPGAGRFGALRSGALEDSNVDLTAELVNMMTAQRAYQANAQTIKTQDQVMSTLVNLR